MTMTKPETIVTITGSNQPRSATQYTSHETTIMLTETSMANLTVFLVPDPFTVTYTVYAVARTLID
jgi:hypothetical protein